MHLVTLPQPILLGVQGKLAPGEYLMEDLTAAELIVGFPDHGIRMNEWKAPNWQIADGAIAERKILIAGSLSYGDCIMLTPVLRAFKQAFPKCSLHVAVLPYYRGTFLHLDYIDGFASWPLPYAEYQQFDEVHFLEHFSRHPDAKTKHLTEIFANLCGVAVTDRRCDFQVTADEKDWAAKTFPRTEEPDSITYRKRIGIQVQASQHCRTYPAEKLRDVMTLLLKKGWELWMMGRFGEYACNEIGHIHDLSRHANTFRAQAAFLTTCDVFLGPDSGFIHAAGAMGIPAVGLYGPYPWQLRTAQYPTVLAITGHGDCAPCFHISTKMQPPFPVNQPCFRQKKCMVLDSIEPEHVVRRIELTASAAPLRVLPQSPAAHDPMPSPQH